MYFTALILLMAMDMSPAEIIPRTIIQTSKYKAVDIDRPDWIEYQNSLREVNPTFELLHFDDEEASAFVSEHYAGTILEIAYNISTPIMRADLFRLAAVYKLGGFYMDMDMLAKSSFEPLARSIDNGDYQAVFPKEWWMGAEYYSRIFDGRQPSDVEDYWQVGQYAFAAVAGHPFIKDALQQATTRSLILMKNKGDDVESISDMDILGTTGPYMFTELYHTGRKKGKYQDILHLKGDWSQPVLDRSHGGNDWHKFGPSAEHMLSHTWTKPGHRGLQTYYEYGVSTNSPTKHPTGSPTKEPCKGQRESCTFGEGGLDNGDCCYKFKCEQGYASADLENRGYCVRDSQICSELGEYCGGKIRCCPGPGVECYAPTRTCRNDVPCFSPTSIIIEKSKGEMPIKDLKHGDSVLAANKKFQPYVLSSHSSPSKPTHFLQIHTDSSKDSTEALEVSPNHLVFLHGKNLPVQAGTVKVGDSMVGIDGPVTVTKVSSVTRNGFYNALTRDATLFVDGILASSTTANDEGKVHAIFGPFKVHFHTLASWVAGPLLHSQCSTITSFFCETQVDDGSGGTFNAWQYLFVYVSALPWFLQGLIFPLVAAIAVVGMVSYYLALVGLGTGIIILGIKFLASVLKIKMGKMA